MVSRMSDITGLQPVARSDTPSVPLPSLQALSPEWARKLLAANGGGEDRTIHKTYNQMAAELRRDPPTFEYAFHALAARTNTTNPIEAHYNSVKEQIPGVRPDLGKSIIAYTGSLYTQINGAQRSRDLKRAMFLVANIINGLDELPEMPKDTKVVRWTRLPDRIFNAHVEGAIICDFGVSSTSKKLAGVPGFGNGAGHKVKITITGEDLFSGKDVSAISFYPREEEVLFRPGAAFIVLSVEGEGDYTHIKYGEVFPPTGNKTLLWLDDKPENNRRLVDRAKDQGVFVMQVKDPEAAIKFFCANAYLMQRDTSQFRIITDMASTKDNETGTYMHSFLRKAFSYPEPMMMYTSARGMRYWRENPRSRVPKTLYTDGSALLAHESEEIPAGDVVQRFTCFEHDEQHFPEPPFTVLKRMLMPANSRCLQHTLRLGPLDNVVASVWAWEDDQSSGKSKIRMACADHAMWEHLYICHVMGGRVALLPPSEFNDPAKGVMALWQKQRYGDYIKIQSAANENLYLQIDSESLVTSDRDSGEDMLWQLTAPWE